jgi:hypothetical protein
MAVSVTKCALDRRADLRAVRDMATSVVASHR